MAVSTSIYQELLFLGSSVLVGMGLFFIYDILRIFRRILPHGNIWIGVEDFLYWIIFTGVVFVLLYRENDGMVRGFAFGGLLVGMACYYLLLSRLIVHCQVWIWKKILGILGKVLGFFVRPVWKTLKKVAAFCGKRLKKFVRAVKIGLCKL